MERNNKHEVNTKGYKNLSLQMLNVKYFMATTGGGIFFFATSYINNQWDRAQALFWFWGAGISVWLLFLIVTYRLELWARLTLLLFSTVKKIIPIIIGLISLYFILFPFDFKKTISFLILASIIFGFIKNKRILGEIPSNTPKRKKNRKVKENKGESTQELEDWLATETSNEQGVDYREINLEGRPLKTLEFRVKPSTVFWRAGFKLTDPNGTILPLRTKNSLLFHIGSSESRSKFGITAYGDGDWDPTLNKTLDYDNASFISIRFEVNEKNFIKGFINNKLEYKPKARIDPRILEKVFLAAWGDGNPYRVEFDDIQFTTR